MSPTRAPAHHGRRRRAPGPGPAREVALNVLQQVDTRKAFADLQLTRILSRTQLDTRDTALATELVNGTLRLRGRLDWILSGLVRAGLESLNSWILNVLRLGLYQILYLDRIPAHAAVDESVKLARKYGHAGTAGLVNGVLRRVLRDRADLPDPELIEDSIERLSVCGSHPRWIVERWLRRLGEDETRALLEANNQPRPLGLRINPTRADRETVRRALEERGIEAEASAVSTLSLRVPGNLVPAELPEFQLGQVFVQDEGETLVATLLGAERGQTVLDLCASPGGKACQIQEGRGSEGFLIAVDAQRNRLGRLLENVIRMGVSRVAVVCADGRELALSRPVDRVLVDSPCSGLGVLGRRSDARWRKTEISLRSLLTLERELLRAGASHVRPGGVLVYSVCSFEPEEGELAVKGFLTEHPDFELEDAAQWVLEAAVTEGMVLLYPHRHGTDGVFAARMRRKV